MKLELFVLPQVMRRDFAEAFLLEKEDFAVARPDWVRRMEEYPGGFDGWYESAFLWEKMSPHIPAVDFEQALAFLRERTGKVLFLSEAETSGKGGGLILNGRVVYDYVAMADPRELADCLAYEWYNEGRLFLEGALTLPSEVYVFDTTLEWVIVFTHEYRNGDAEARFCKAFGV